MEIKIRETTGNDETNWDEYVKTHPAGTIFHSMKWKKVIEKTYAYPNNYLIAFENGQHSSEDRICGILPMFRIKSLLFGDSLISIPFAERGGVLADNDETETRLLEKAKSYADRIGCDYLELRNQKMAETLLAKDLYYNFRKEITPDHDRNLKAIPRKARRMIRQGMKADLYSETGIHLLDQFYTVLAKNYHRLGTPIFSKTYFTNIVKVFGDSMDILIVKKENQTIAGVLTFFFKDQVLPYYAGSDFNFWKIAPNDFMYWELMRFGAEKGYRIFDFGRSKKDTGSFHFKRHWGFEPERLYYQYHLVKAKSLPNLSPANPKYKHMIEAWQKMPFGLTKLIGPMVAKYLA